MKHSTFVDELTSWSFEQGRKQGCLNALRGVLNDLFAKYCPQGIPRLK